MLKKCFLMIGLVVGLLGLMGSLDYADAAEYSPEINVNATVLSPTLTVELDTDEGCAPEGLATQIDLVVDDSYPEFMIAPNRWEMDNGGPTGDGANWHFIKINANANWRLEVQGTDLTSGLDTIDISNLRYWYSGTWAGYNQVETNPLSTADADNKWDLNQIAEVPNFKVIYSCNSDVNGAKSYMSYQLDIASANAGVYSGTIVYQVVEE